MIFLYLIEFNVFVDLAKNFKAIKKWQIELNLDTEKLNYKIKINGYAQSFHVLNICCCLLGNHV